MTTPTTATFHPFPRLPAKLRARIWELTVEPRIVEVRMLTRPALGGRDRRLLRSSTSASAQLQPCREARDHLTTCPDSAYRFEKAFSELTSTSHDGPVSDPRQQDEEGRYVWFNFDKDMLSVGRTDLTKFLAVADRIYRLRLDRDLSDECFFHFESELITKRWRGMRFKSLTEIHLMDDTWGIRTGYLMTEDIGFVCGPENVYFGDARTEEIMNSIDLDAMVTREHEELYKLEEQE